MSKTYDTSDLHRARNEHPGYEVKVREENGSTSFIYVDTRTKQPFAAWTMGPGLSHIHIGPLA